MIFIITNLLSTIIFEITIIVLMILLNVIKKHHKLLTILIILIHSAMLVYLIFKGANLEDAMLIFLLTASISIIINDLFIKKRKRKIKNGI